MELPEEHRQFTRVLFPVSATIRVGEKTWPTDLLDISLKGALFHVPPTWTGSVGKQAVLSISIAENIQIFMDGSIAHIENQHAGIACEHIDVDSVAHLRRLVELNLGDDSRLHRELAAMIKLS